MRRVNAREQMQGSKWGGNSEEQMRGHFAASSLDKVEFGLQPQAPPVPLHDRANVGDDNTSAVYKAVGEMIKDKLGIYHHLYWFVLGSALNVAIHIEYLKRLCNHLTINHYSANLMRFVLTLCIVFNTIS